MYHPLMACKISIKLYNLPALCGLPNISSILSIVVVMHGPVANIKIEVWYNEMF